MAGFDDEQSTVLSAIEMSPAAEAVFRVTIIDGPDRGASVVVDGSETLLAGQSPVCALRLTDATVSRRHLEMEIVGSRLRCRDLDSSNGTYVGALRIVEAWLEGGEILVVGESRLHVERVEGAPPARIVTDIAFGEVRGVSREMRRLFPIFARLAQVDVPVLIEGETGTGKEVVARSIHAEGARKAGPLVVFDCTTVAAQLLESELFGHERGAFTGAVAQRRGLFEQAHGGTLFIDEIGDLPIDLQPKLLRALERSEVRRVGSDKWIQCDVRVIAATRRNVDTLVQEGRFRDDLFHRLAIGRVELPPLRKRRGDVLALVEQFCGEAGASVRTIPSSVLSDWMRAEWPGNVRQLRNAVTRELALGDLERVEIAVDTKRRFHRRRLAQRRALRRSVRRRAAARGRRVSTRVPRARARSERRQRAARSRSRGDRHALLPTSSRSCSAAEKDVNLETMRFLAVGVVAVALATGAMACLIAYSNYDNRFQSDASTNGPTAFVTDDGGAIAALAVTSSDLFYAVNDAIKRVPLDGGVATTWWTEDAGVTDLASDRASTIAWSAKQVVRKATVNAPASSIVVTPNVGAFNKLAANASGLAWFQGNQTTCPCTLGGVELWDSSTPSPLTYDVDASKVAPADVAIDDQGVTLFTPGSPAFAATRSTEHFQCAQGAGVRGAQGPHPARDRDRRVGRSIFCDRFSIGNARGVRDDMHARKFTGRTHGARDPRRRLEHFSWLTNTATNCFAAVRASTAARASMFPPEP